MLLVILSVSVFLCGLSIPVVDLIIRIDRLFEELDEE